MNFLPGTIEIRYSLCCVFDKLSLAGYTLQFRDSNCQKIRLALWGPPLTRAVCHYVPEQSEPKLNTFYSGLVVRSRIREEEINRKRAPQVSIPTVSFRWQILL